MRGRGRGGGWRSCVCGGVLGCSYSTAALMGLSGVVANRPCQEGAPQLSVECLHLVAGDCGKVGVVELILGPGLDEVADSDEGFA